MWFIIIHIVLIIRTLDDLDINRRMGDLNHLILLFVEFFPEHVFQFCYSHATGRREGDDWYLQLLG